MGRLIHFEVHAEDPERAARFYARVLGWDAKRWEGPVDYWLLTTGPSDQPGINGAIALRRGAAPTEGEAVNAFVCTAEVEELEAAVDEAIAAGGELAVPRMAIAGVGWLAYVKDTEGNVLGLMQADESAA
jgi:predicted enzyme related to lactoylglutathione lyase